MKTENQFFIIKSKILTIYLFFIMCFFLFLIPYNKLLAQENTIRPELLNDNVFYYRQGFSKEYLQYTSRNFKDAIEKNYPDNLWRIKNGTPIRLMDLLGFVDNKIVHYTIATIMTIKENTGYDHETFGLFIPMLSQNAEIFLNGKKIYESVSYDKNGKMHHVRKKRNLTIHFPGALLKKGENVFLIHIQAKYADSTVGLYYPGDYIVGLYDEIKKKSVEIVELILISLYLFVGLYHLLLFQKRRKEKYNLYFAIFSIFIFIYLMSRSNIIWLITPNSDWISRIEFFILFLMVPFFLYFIQDLFFQKIDRVAKYYLFFCILLALPVPIVLMPINFNLLFIWQISALTIVGYIVYIFIQGLRQRKPEAPPLLTGFFIVVGTSIFDILDSILFNIGIAFTKYGFFIFVMGIAVVLARRFLRVHHQVEELNATLEQKVADRTRELQETLHKVQTLKVQQDGDYFLTSLLIKPLGKISGIGDPVLIEGYEQQKKKFEFNQRTGEIGGDLNVANRIRLKGQEFIVFLNGDAMGKSIQGAGGALVMGVVFNSFITRTQLSALYQNKSPEQWIKDCYQDLQNVFETFDGSMLASMVLGLIDVYRGVMYHINAEHPWTVLYRNGKAKFIENELSLRKVGISFEQDKFAIKCTQLRHGDIIIAGSDGRDDIMLGIDEHGQRIINEDEYLFLDYVEKANGDLNQIAQLISASGEVTDDFTLLKAQFNGISTEEKYSKKNLSSSMRELFRNAVQKYRSRNYSEAEQIFQKIIVEEKLHPETLPYLVRIALKNKEYEKVAKFSEEYLSLFPLDNQIIFFAAFAWKKIKQYKQAIDYGETLRLREPTQQDNLINLADAYRLQKNLQRAFFLVDQVFIFNPNNPRAVRLKEILNQISQDSAMQEEVGLS